MAVFSLLLVVIFSVSVARAQSVSNPVNNVSDQPWLLGFKAGITFDPNNSLGNWNSHTPLCNWTGISCSPTSHTVLALNLSFMSLEGTISPLLGNLSSLQSLDLESNALDGHIPPQLGRLSRLQELWLNDNQLQGTIPPTLSGCHSLQVLALSFNQLEGSISPELSLLTQLNYLYLGKNNITGTIPSSFKNLSALIELDISQNRIGGTIPSFFGNFSDLNSLGSSYNQLQGSIPVELGIITQLKMLYLNGNNLTGPIPTALLNCSALEELVLSRNRLNGHIPWELGTKLANLQILSLWGNYLSGNIPNSIGNCSNLTTLLLGPNFFDVGIVPMELGKLKLLVRLDLHYNQLVSDSSGTLAFLTALTNCSQLDYIDVSNNNLTGVLPLSIGNLSSILTYLDLSDNNISGSIPQHMADLSNLAYINFGNNLFRGSIPNEFTRLHKLQRLILSGNLLEGNIPTEIGQMQSLGLLSLSRNKLSGKIPDSLCSHQQLRQVQLDHNNLSGGIPASLEGCKNLELLDLSYNKLGGRIPREVISSIKNLQFYLNLSWNSLQGSLPQEVSKLVMAQAIDVSGNQLNGMIPSALGDSTALEHLNLSHNSFDGPIPGTLAKLKNLQDIDLSFNNLSGQIPEKGLFSNETIITLLMGNPGLCGPQNFSLPACPKQGQRKDPNLKKIIVSAVGIIIFVLCSSVLGLWWRQKFSRRRFGPSNLFLQRLRYPKFSYQDLVTATNGFDEANLLGVGNFGSVYKGILRDGRVVAIKALNLQNEDAQKSFNTESKVLGRIRHRNLIRILSVCFYPDFKGLVLQFASNESLENHLYPYRELSKLGLSECLNIALDVAHGMEYLHHDSSVQVVHCDLKPSNVLLDSNMTALVTDFGISRFNTTQNSMESSNTTFALRGTIGYIAPEYGLGGRPSVKGDVYSYGILILEMVTRKKPSDAMFVGDLNLKKWVRSAFPDRLADVVDSRFFGDVNPNMEENRCLISFVSVGLHCTSESPTERPTMRDVARGLESLKTSLMGSAAASNLTSTISDLLHNDNPSAIAASGSQSSTF